MGDIKSYARTPEDNEYSGGVLTSERERSHEDNVNEIENNIRQLRAEAAQKTPLQLIAGAMQALKYAEMMQLSTELKALTNGGGQPDTPASIAALLHEWATKHGSIDTSGAEILRRAQAEVIKATAESLAKPDLGTGITAVGDASALAQPPSEPPTS